MRSISGPRAQLHPTSTMHPSRSQSILETADGQRRLRRHADDFRSQPIILESASLVVDRLSLGLRSDSKTHGRGSAERDREISCH